MKNMNPLHHPYPKIGQFRDTIRFVKDRCEEQGVSAPILEYTARVKAHGTNAGVVIKSDGSFYFQSRNRVITPTDDNEGFASWANQNIDNLRKYASKSRTVVIYGEWCGGNIQSGVAINKLPKMFVVFEIMTIEDYGDNEIIRRHGNNLVTLNDPSISLYPVSLFGGERVTVDFARPELSTDRIIVLTNAAEAECPIAKYFGVSGTGEGLVFGLERIDGLPEYSFKSKGEKHSKSPVKTIGAVDLVEIAKIKDFAQFLLNGDGRQDRYEQAVAVLRSDGNPMNSAKEIPLLIQWIRADVAAENINDIDQSGLDPGKIWKELINHCKERYRKEINTSF
jgi:RNA ligase